MISTPLLWGLVLSDEPANVYSSEAQRYASGAADSRSEVRAEAIGGHLLGIGRCLTALPPLRTVRATFTAHRSSISKAV